MSAEAEIHAMVGEWLEAMRQGGEAGADGYASFFTDDAIVLAPNADRIDGRAGGIVNIIVPAQVAGIMVNICFRGIFNRFEFNFAGSDTV